MTFTNDTAARAAFKRLYGKAHTSNAKDIVNEAEASSLSLAAQTIFADTIPATGAAAVAGNIAVAVTIPLVLDGSSAGKAYKATITGAVPAELAGRINPLTGTVYATGQRVGYFIPEFLGADFRVRLRDGIAEVPPLASQDWIFDYYAGIVTSEDNLSLSLGTVDGYVYVGALASDTAANWMRSGNDIYNRNSGTVLVSKDLIVGEDGYVARNFGAGSDGYVAGRLAIGGTSPYDSINTTTKLFINNGDITMQDTTLANVPSIDMRMLSSPVPDAELGLVAFGNYLSSTANRRIAKISGLASNPYDAEAGQLTFYTATTSGTLVERMRIDEDGHIGIGTGQPAAMLHLRSSASAAAGTTLGALLRFDYDDVSWTAGDVVGALEWFGNDASAGASGVRARVQAVARSGLGGTALEFLTTADSSTTLNSVMSINHNQFVGIGTTAPDTRLHVMASDASASSNSGAIATFERAGAGYLQLLTPDANESGLLFGLTSNSVSGGIIYNVGGDNAMRLRTGGNNTRIIIDSAGLVGINTTTPNTTLNVYNANESATQTNFTQDIANAGINIETDYTNPSFTPGIFWSTQNNNATKPKAGIYTRLDGSGSKLYLGTSNSYATGITNNGIVIDHNGNIGMGTDSPQTKLQVNTIGQQWAIWGADVAAASYMTFRQPGSSAAVGYLGTGGGGAISSGTGADLALRAESNLIFASGGNNERVRVSSTGLVGIGLNNPTAMLEITNAPSTSEDILRIKRNTTEILYISDSSTYTNPPERWLDTLVATDSNGRLEWGGTYKIVEFSDDFIADNFGTWTTAVTGSTVTLDTTQCTEQTFGVVKLNVPCTSATNYAILYSQQGALNLAAAITVFDAMIKMSPISQADPNYDIRIGIGDTVSDAIPTHGVWFECTGGNWFARVSDNGTVWYNTDTGTADTSEWTRLSIEMRTYFTIGARTDINFYINDVLEHSVSGASLYMDTDQVHVFAQVESNTAGANDMDLFIDYISYKAIPQLRTRG
jgi:hypothetical protein